MSEVVLRCFATLLIILSGLLYSVEGQARLRLTPETEEESQTKLDQPYVVFGQYSLQIGYTKPNFTSIDLYEKLYGSTPGHFTFGVDWLPLKKYVGLGLRTKMGYFVDSGKTLVANDQGDMEINPDGDTGLTLIPLQLAGLLRVSPFSQKYLVLDVWYGYEFAYFQEARIVKKAENEPIQTPVGQRRLAADASTSNKALVNSGWKRSMVAGIALNILLNPLDESSVKSMHSTMGIGAVYLSPFMERISSQAEGLRFDRNTYGFTFTFETLW
jgi:hypothetical protein